MALLLAAPFRLPVNLGAQDAFLLVPLYVVLASASLALLVRAFKGSVPALPIGLAGAAAAFAALDGLSLLWALDLQEGSKELAFFVFPFAALLTVVARSPFASWLPRALAVGVVGLAVVFAAIGLWQEKTHRIFFAHDLRVANTYTSFFRVTSVFKDPSIYGRHLVLAISVLIVLLWLRKVRFLVAAPVVAVIFAGLYFSYSQSSMAVLFAMAFLITIVVGDRTSRRIVIVAAVVGILVAGAIAGRALSNHSLRHATSGRSRLVSVTARVIRNHPLVGVGVGSQPLASHNEAKTRLGARKDAVAHDAADGARRARRRRARRLRLAARRRGTAAGTRRARARPRARLLARGELPRARPALVLLQRLLRGPAHVGRPRASRRRRSSALVVSRSAEPAARGCRAAVRRPATRPTRRS